MELIAGDAEALHLGIADFDALLIAAGVERALDFQTGLGGPGTDQLDHGKTIHKHGGSGWCSRFRLSRNGLQGVHQLPPQRYGGGSWSVAFVIPVGNCWHATPVA